MTNKTKTISIDLVCSNYSLLEIYTPGHPVVLNSPYDGENSIYQITSNFDYEMNTSGSWVLYIDIGLKMIPGIGIDVRSEFDILHEDVVWDDIFVVSLLEPVVEESFEACFDAFRSQCKENNISIESDLEVTREMITSATQNIIDLYFNYRKKDDIVNASLRDEINISITPGEYTKTVLHGPFIIIDEVLFDNPKFNFIHNRKQFSDKFPYPRYLTMRTHAGRFEDKEISLSGLDLVFLSRCIDFAVNLLLGEHADTLLEGLKTKGFTPDIQKNFFKYTTDFSKQINDSLRQANASIINMHEDIDWNKMIRQL